MNVALILASGIGTRVGASIPKQFIKILGKPVLAYTLEIFEQNKNIDAIEIVCNFEWRDYVEKICSDYNINKKRWICNGGDTFQESTKNGIDNLKYFLSPDDIVVISFGVSPLTPQIDIDDSIDVCKKHGNAIAAKDIDLCTCIKDDDYSTTQSILRENLKGFANPWTFKFGEICKVYESAEQSGILYKVEPHTTSLYFALGKRLWFSKSTSIQTKITTREDLKLFEGILLLKEKNKKIN